MTVRPNKSNALTLQMRLKLGENPITGRKAANN
jgi:hypothetical protein